MSSLGALGSSTAAGVTCSAAGLGGLAGVRTGILGNELSVLGVGTLAGIASNVGMGSHITSQTSTNQLCSGATQVSNVTHVSGGLAHINNSTVLSGSEALISCQQAGPRLLLNGGIHEHKASVVTYKVNVEVHSPRGACGW